MHTTRTAAAALALLGGIGLATVAPAQTTSPGTTQGSTGSAATTGSAPTTQGQVTPATPDQTTAFIKSLEDLVTQSLPGYQPSVGAKVPQAAKTQPMPADAAQALPQAKDHHVLKTDDQTIMIVDPTTGQIVGLITASDDDDDDNSTTGMGTPKGTPSNSGKQ